MTTLRSHGLRSLRLLSARRHIGASAVAVLLGAVALQAGPAVSADASPPMLAVGSVWAWGSNYSGALGDGTTVDSSTPVLTHLLPAAVQIAAGYDFSMALTADGHVWAWGNGAYTGQGLSYPSDVPVLVKSPSGTGALAHVVGIAAGMFHALALTADGHVYAWGENTDGQLGDGSTADSHLPVEVDGLSNVTQVGAGGGYTSLALTADGHVWAWGSNYHGALGVGTLTGPQTCHYGYDPCSTTPVEVVGPSGQGWLSGITEVAVGQSGMALARDGRVWNWGYNGQGQLGIGTNVGPDPSCSCSATPVPVPGLRRVTEVSSGQGFSLALTSDGHVYAWGYNWGRLGDGTDVDRYSPVQVVGLARVIRIAAGASHGLAITSDGHAWAWGDNWASKLGNGSTTASLIPVQVEGLTGAVQVAGGYNHSLAIRQLFGGRPR